jgi:hypothetical protein
MNQILFIDKSKKNEGLDIRKTGLISAVVILIFSIIIIGLGISGLIKNIKNQKASEPVLKVMQLEDQVEINITHDKAIDKIIYSWNSEEETVLQGKGRNGGDILFFK